MRRILVTTGLLFVLGSCSGGGSIGRIVFELALSGVTDLGVQRGHYEGWAVVNGLPVSTGKFIVDGAFSPARVTNLNGHRVYGTVAGATFGPAATGLGSAFPFITSATHFFVTIEPEGDADGAPSGNVIIAGEIIGESGALSFAGDLAVGTPANSDLSVASGDCSLINPTGGGIDANGVWFSAQAAVPGSTGISLSPAAGSWTYEGWVIDPGTGDRHSTGKFRATGRFDIDAQAAPTRGVASIGLLDPGQDFVNAATIGATQATDLVDGSWRVFITVEPSADNAAGPFPLRIFDADIPTTAIDPGNGSAAEDVDLNDLSMNLPQLDVTPSPGAVALTGQAPGGLGPATAGLYALWADVGGAIELVVRFVVDDAADQVTSVDGATVFGSTTAFSFDSMNTGLPFPAVESAIAFFVTLEPQGDPEPGPSEHIVLDGLVQPSGTALTVAGAGFGIADFTSGVSGTFVTMTPTDNASGVAANDGMGLWFRTLAGGSPSLSLPLLPPQWRYEAWVENPTGAIGPFSLGRFSFPDTADEDAMTWNGRGSANTGFNVPGQDLLVSAPGTVISGPLDLTGGFDTAITLEPFPDNHSGPSPFIVLDGQLPGVASVPSMPLVNRVGATFPTGALSFDL